MNLDEALKGLKSWRFAEYFKWKHGIRYDQRLGKKTEEEFLKMVSRKTMNPFIAWERTAEYKKLLVLYLETKLADDLDQIYNTVSENAKSGDDKAVRLFLALQKEIVANAKVAKESFKSNVDDEAEDMDDLILD